MSSTVLRSIEWIALSGDASPAEIHVGARELQRFFRHAGFAAAFLEAKRRRRLRDPSRDVKVSVVFDGSTPVEFGHPCDWSVGVAENVLSGRNSTGPARFTVANLHFAVNHEDGIDDEFAAGPRTAPSSHQNKIMSSKAKLAERLWEHEADTQPLSGAQARRTPAWRSRSNSRRSPTRAASPTRSISPQQYSLSQRCLPPLAKGGMEDPLRAGG